MGNILFVRVSLSTFDEKEVKKRYPQLYKLAWDEQDNYIPASQYYGILELITSLEQASLYADWNKELKELVRSSIQELIKIKEELNSLILNWKPKEANPLTYKIEEKLDDLEKKIKTQKLYKS